MKNSKLILMFLGIISFSSCLNEFDEIQNLDNSSDKLIVSQFNSYDDNLADSISNPDSVKVVSFSVLRGGNFEFTYAGYSSYTIEPAEKTMFTKEYADFLGIQPYVVYIYRRMTVTGIIEFAGEDGVQVYSMDSPNCGFISTGNGVQRGYTSRMEGRQFIVTTNLFYIISDAYGNSIDRCVPEELNRLRWNYGFIWM